MTVSQDSQNFRLGEAKGKHSYLESCYTVSFMISSMPTFQWFLHRPPTGHWQPSPTLPLVRTARRWLRQTPVSAPPPRRPEPSPLPSLYTLFTENPLVPPLAPPPLVPPPLVLPLAVYRRRRGRIHGLFSGWRNWRVGNGRTGRQHLLDPIYAIGKNAALYNIHCKRCSRLDVTYQTLPGRE